ncbi:MAG: hypothetical protein HEQ35_25955 [Gloeotrichia echinulata IR180]|nr:hypothetical protein [Gloeotrichia echinulata DEX184]
MGIGDWGHFGKLSASLGTLRQAQCIAGDWGLGIGDTSTSSVHRWGLGTGDWGHFDKLSASLGTGDWELGSNEK